MLTLGVVESAAEAEGVSSPDALPPNAEEVLDVGFCLFGDDGYGCGGSWYSGGGRGVGDTPSSPSAEKGFAVRVAMGFGAQRYAVISSLLNNSRGSVRWPHSPIVPRRPEGDVSSDSTKVPEMRLIIALLGMLICIVSCTPRMDLR